MKVSLFCLSVLMLCGCAATPQEPPHRPVISYVTGQYKAGADDGRHPRFSELYVTHDSRFVLGVDNHGQPVRATGIVAPGPKASDGDGPSWIELIPDAPFAALSIPRRLYVTHYDSYQVLATQPRSPHFWQKEQPADYEYFNDDTSEETPAYSKDVPGTTPVT